MMNKNKEHLLLRKVGYYDPTHLLNKRQLFIETRLGKDNLISIEVIKTGPDNQYSEEAVFLGG